MNIPGIIPISVMVMLLLLQCERTDETRFVFSDQGRPVPAFSSDSAYSFIRTQVDLGPRNPGSEGHSVARDFLYGQLQEYAGERNVFVQTFHHDGYEDESLELYNIIAAFNTESSNRILLAAHWDTRPRAEDDPDNPDLPLAGADDGGSGVGVLLELARLFHENLPPVGVDIILFDGEDYGKSGELDNYFLGSRYWSRNQPVDGYNPRFGILLDMVGGKHAKFPKEGYSIRFAPSLVDAVWSLADEMGYGDLFPDEEGTMISDDHVMVQRYADISMINLIHHERGESGETRFPPYWHTHDDNMGIIDSNTLEAVGTILSELIYNRIN